MRTTSVRILCCVFLLGIMLSPAAENRFAAPGEKLTFPEVYILESEREAGAYITGNLEGFGEYDWGQMPREKELQDRMHTLRADFYLDNGTGDGPLAFYLGPAEYPYNVYLNGRLLVKKGYDKPGTCYSVFEASKTIIPAKMLNFGGLNTVGIQTFTGEERQGLAGFFLSSDELVTRSVFIHNLLNSNFVQAVFFLTIILCAYFLFIFFTRKTREMKYLFIALMSFFYGFNSVNLALFYDYADGLLLAKMSRLGLPLSAAFLALFVVAFTGILSRRLWVKLVILVPSLFCALRILFYASKFEVHDFFTNVTANFIILPLLLFSLLLLIISMFKDKNKFSVPIIIGFVVLVACSVHDVTKLTNFEIPPFWTVPYGYTLLMLGIFFVLANEETAVNFSLVEQQAALNERNASLLQVIENVKTVFASLDASYQQLEAILKQAVTVITGYTEDNRRLREEAVTLYEEINRVIGSLTSRLEASESKVPLAIIKQKNLVTRITMNLEQMNNDLEHTLLTSTETNIAAGNLADLAEASSQVIMESKDIIKRIAEYSRFISEVLATIEDITDRTKILSINAAIEAAKAGVTGRGFTVIAQEIRYLASRSQGNLESSFTNIREVEDTLRRSTGLADQVAGSLLRIIDTSRESATMISGITRHIREQKSASSSILTSVELFITETETINQISEQELAWSEDIKGSLIGMQDTFQEITTMLNEQVGKGGELESFLTEIEKVMQENLHYMTMLKDYTG